MVDLAVADGSFEFIIRFVIKQASFYFLRLLFLGASLQSVFVGV
jgi:hypothetical protein